MVIEPADFPCQNLPMDDEDCHYGCGRPGITRDHVIPRSRAPKSPGSRKGRGLNTGFTVPSCATCNSDRHSEPYPVYAQRKKVDPDLIIATMVRAILIFQDRFNQLAPLRDRQALRDFEKRYGLPQDSEIGGRVQMPWGIQIGRSDKVG